MAAQGFVCCDNCGLWGWDVLAQPCRALWSVSGGRHDNGRALKRAPARCLSAETGAACFLRPCLGIFRPHAPSFTRGPLIMMHWCGGRGLGFAAGGFEKKQATSLNPGRPPPPSPQDVVHRRARLVLDPARIWFSPLTQVSQLREKMGLHRGRGAGGGGVLERWCQSLSFRVGDEPL